MSRVSDPRLSLWHVRAALRFGAGRAVPVQVLIPPLFVRDGHSEHCLPRPGGVVIRRAAGGPEGGVILLGWRNRLNCSGRIRASALQTTNQALSYKNDWLLTISPLLPRIFGSGTSTSKSAVR